MRNVKVFKSNAEKGTHTNCWSSNSERCCRQCTSLRERPIFRRLPNLRHGKYLDYERDSDSEYSINKQEFNRVRDYANQERSFRTKHREVFQVAKSDSEERGLQNRGRRKRNKNTYRTRNYFNSSENISSKIRFFDKLQIPIETVLQTEGITKNCIGKCTDKVSQKNRQIALKRYTSNSSCEDISNRKSEWHTSKSKVFPGVRFNKSATKMNPETSFVPVIYKNEEDNETEETTQCEKTDIKRNASINKNVSSNIFQESSKTKNVVFEKTRQKTETRSAGLSVENKLMQNTIKNQQSFTGDTILNENNERSVLSKPTTNENNETIKFRERSLSRETLKESSNRTKTQEINNALKYGEHIPKNFIPSTILNKKIENGSLQKTLIKHLVIEENYEHNIPRSLTAKKAKDEKICFHPDKSGKLLLNDGKVVKSSKTGKHKGENRLTYNKTNKELKNTNTDFIQGKLNENPWLHNISVLRDNHHKSKFKIASDKDKNLHSMNRSSRYLGLYRTEIAGDSGEARAKVHLVTKCLPPLISPTQRRECIYARSDRFGFVTAVERNTMKNKTSESRRKTEKIRNVEAYSTNYTPKRNLGDVQKRHKQTDVIQGKLVVELVGHYLMEGGHILLGTSVYSLLLDGINAFSQKRN